MNNPNGNCKFDIYYGRKEEETNPTYTLSNVRVEKLLSHAYRNKY